MNELGVAYHPDYMVVFYLDCAAIIIVYTAEYDVMNKKLLRVIREMDEFKPLYGLQEYDYTAAMPFFGGSGMPTTTQFIQTH